MRHTDKQIYQLYTEGFAFGPEKSYKDIHMTDADKMEVKKMILHVLSLENDPAWKQACRSIMERFDKMAIGKFPNRMADAEAAKPPVEADYEMKG